jgi:dipeptidyl aminopeptidase/acylaminoacyl peptidase
MSDSTRIMNQLQAVALNEGLRYKKRLLWRKTGREQFESFPLARWTSCRRQDLLQMLDRTNPTIGELTQAIEQEAEKCPQGQRLMTHPGVGALTALAFMLIIGEGDRFSCGKQIASYLGLVPAEDSSGERRRLGHISKQGNSLLRFLLVEDGRSMIFTRCRDHDTCALYQLEVDGTGLHPITQLELGIQDASAEYSFDGKLAFTGVGRNGIICAIQLMNTQGTNLKRLTPAPIAARQPDWSPDARRIAFSTHCRGLDGNPENEEIWTVNAKGDALLRLTNNGDDYFSGPHDFHPSWSPQGDAIVFERDAPDYSSSGIFIMKSDGSGGKEVLALGSSARKSILRQQHDQNLNSRTARRLKQIEDGGAMPQWGPAAN